MGAHAAALALTDPVVEDSRPGGAEFEAAGLYDPAASDAPERLALLEYLVGVGATVDEIAAADPAEYAGVASRIALWGPGEWLSIDAVMARAGIQRELFERVWRAAGFPDAKGLRALPARDVEMLDIVRAGIDVFGEEVTIQLLRVLGAAAARVADALISAFMVNVVPQAMEQDPSGLALARANTEALSLLDALAHGFDTILRHHIERGFRSDDLLNAVPDVDLVHRSIGFADLVDSTAWTQQLDLGALSRALTDFDALASEVVIGRGGRVVKLIGDEVMFVALDAASAVDIALALIDAFDSHAVLPPVRAGIASGAVLARDGDFSGAVVNLAARAVKVAAPSSLVVDRATREAVANVVNLASGSVQVHSLKGFADAVELSQITRAE